MRLSPTAGLKYETCPQPSHPGRDGRRHRPGDPAVAVGIHEKRRCPSRSRPPPTCEAWGESRWAGSGEADARGLRVEKSIAVPGQTRC